MKKLFAMMLAFLLLIIVSACGNEAAEESEKKDGQEAAPTEVKHDHDEDHAEGPHEPGAEDVCAFCNMKVYTEADPMGVFTAQAKTKDGEYVFFDDSGCLLNWPRRDEVEYEEKWVQDYLTSEWIEADSAIPVKADLKTPMKYGYAFFKDEDSAEKFVSENVDKNPVMATWQQIDEISKERFMKKMQMDGGSMDKKEDSDMEKEKSEESGH
ncbi:nitrous oxide reductase accessory protein NosL [Mesobacillus subterraneus]|uniref:NosL n=1 Tax=Mesobacillus subterraneus TaxID=285983 RepID=A0A3R9DT16_9BACI|nr:nitrous oxide reductase accessory protein NosL [Mesobacillus subterraneus]RSD26705.1 hypothetical protein EJA10_12615 [Mesobacillus subterraneus]